MQFISNNMVFNQWQVFQQLIPQEEELSTTPCKAQKTLTTMVNEKAKKAQQEQLQPINLEVIQLLLPFIIGYYSEEQQQLKEDRVPYIRA